MKDAVKQFIRLCVPPLIYGLKTRLFNNMVSWRGDYQTWLEASKFSEGYADKAVIDRVINAMRQVVSGKAIFERDSVLFDEIQYSWPVLAGLLKAAAADKSCLRVLDFGGALGSSYYQNRKFLEGLNAVKWCVIEQADFVKAGKKEFETEELSFCYDIENALVNGGFNVILLSGLLPYVENPYDILNKLLELGSKFIIIDRTPVIAGGNDRLTVQQVPGAIYRASYPAWFFSEEKLMQYMAEKYSLITAFDALGGEFQIKEPCLTAQTKGYIYKIKDKKRIG